MTTYNISPKQQLSLDLIHHEANGAVIDQRPMDGYINATALCIAGGKKWSHYWGNTATQAFIAELEADAGIPASVLVQSTKGGVLQGTWVHPLVAIHLGQWVSAKFAVMVSKWVSTYLGAGIPAPAPTRLPVHLERYMANDSSVPPGHFSVLQETGVGLFGPLHKLGFDIPKGWVPDISVGKMFCQWLRTNLGVDPDTFPKYAHDYLDGRAVIYANAYPDEYLAQYRTWFRTVWLPVQGPKYFKSKDPASLAYLNRLPALAAPVPRPKLGT